MRYLLDTHAVFWYFEGSPDLSAKAKSVIGDSGNEIFVSIVSAWEIAIKIATAAVEDMTFLSADENVSKYDVKWLW